ncbi:MAG: DnaJ domain-containing protein [Nanoarchaeota archaeon]|mgnify:FL=1
MATNYYLVLGVPQNASPIDIKRAYRQQALLYHPDINHRKHAAEIFRLVREAYGVLSNPDSKRRHDSELRDLEHRMAPHKTIDWETLRNFKLRVPPKVYKKINIDPTFKNG